MKEAAKKLDFLQAAQYRDEMLKMEDLIKEKFPSWTIHNQAKKKNEIEIN